jgi:hypothetical protein
VAGWEILNIVQDTYHGDWNYIIHPSRRGRAALEARDVAIRRSPALAERLVRIDATIRFSFL